MSPHKKEKVTSAGLLIALGVIFGDIGTSPLYVIKAIIGNQPISNELVYGGLSCIFWTLTLQTTIKYVWITLRADNKGEGGIFALYALVRRNAFWLFYPAIIGGAALLADGVITPSISVTSAIEGLQILNPDIPVVPIVIFILSILFFFQRFGTRVLGKAFGPVMVVWFLMLASFGFVQVVQHPAIFKAINPYYAYMLLTAYPSGFWLLGAVFLCTTGAEALYSDLGHCGKQNIRVSWIFVKTCLLLNYFGQGAWLTTFNGTVLGDRNPFYFMMPEGFLPIGILIATCATIIASQALISGSYTLISEATRLNFWPKVRIIYPTLLKGQMYLPSVNRMLWAGCIGVVLFFQQSTNMEAAYGLSITITMLMTSILLAYFLIRSENIIGWGGLLPILVFMSVETAFLIANLSKFLHGGWVTVLIGAFLFTIMWSWYRARKIKNRYTEFINLDKYLPVLKELSEDQTVPKFATNLVFLTSADYANEIESKIIYSIIKKQPKRADVYWFVHVHVLDTPHAQEYSVKVLVPGKVIRVDLHLGFRIEPRINLYFRNVIEELVQSKEIDITSRYESLKKYNIDGDFRFVVIERVLTYDHDLPLLEEIIMDIYSLLKGVSLSEEKAFELDTSVVTVEKIPLITLRTKRKKLSRVK